MINQEAWAEFVQHRIELKKPLTPLATKKLQRKLIQITKADQQRCIDDSIENGWRGLFIKNYLGVEHGARGEQRVSKKPDSSATRHHERNKRAFAEAIAEEQSDTSVQPVSGEIHPSLVISR